jgi:hypothetical protein
MFVGLSPIIAHIVSALYVTLILIILTFGPIISGLIPLKANMKLTNHASILIDWQNSNQHIFLYTIKQIVVSYQARPYCSSHIY